MRGCSRQAAGEHAWSAYAVSVPCSQVSRRAACAQDLDKHDAAAEKRRESVLADLGGVRGQLEGAEAANVRLQTEKEGALSELHAKQGAPCQRSQQTKHSEHAGASAKYQGQLDNAEAAAARLQMQQEWAQLQLHAKQDVPQ